MTKAKRVQLLMSHFVRTFKKRKIFLDQLELGASLSFAAAAAGGAISQFRRWKQTDADFAADWADAIEAGTDFIEDAALERALKKSDPLMMMILKARRPEKFDRASKLELSGGVSVEGSKSKLLNKIAKLQAESSLSSPVEEGEPEVLEADVTPEQPILGLPAPPSGQPIPRGRKRRSAAEGIDARRDSASK